MQELIKILTSNIFPALLLSIVIECVLIYALFRKARYCYYVLLLNVLTNPLLNLIMLCYYNYVGMANYYPLLYVLEVVVVIVEGFILSKLWERSLKIALLASLLINVASYFAGVLVF